MDCCGFACGFVVVLLWVGCRLGGWVGRCLGCFGLRSYKMGDVMGGGIHCIDVKETAAMYWFATAPSWPKAHKPGSRKQLPMLRLLST